MTSQARARSLAELAAAASTRFPGERVGGYGMTVSPDPSYSVLQAESSRTTAAGQRVVIANRAVHTGDIFGLPSKAIMSLASLMAAVQAVSGVALWWRRRSRPVEL